MWREYANTRVVLDDDNDEPHGTRTLRSTYNVSRQRVVAHDELRDCPEKGRHCD